MICRVKDNGDILLDHCLIGTWSVDMKANRYTVNINRFKKEFLTIANFNIDNARSEEDLIQKYIAQELSGQKFISISSETDLANTIVANVRFGWTYTSTIQNKAGQVLIFSKTGEEYGHI